MAKFLNWDRPNGPSTKKKGRSKCSQTLHGSTNPFRQTLSEVAKFGVSLHKPGRIWQLRGLIHESLRLPSCPGLAVGISVLCSTQTQQECNTLTKIHSSTSTLKGGSECLTESLCGPKRGQKRTSWHWRACCNGLDMSIVNVTPPTTLLGPHATTYL